MQRVGGGPRRRRAPGFFFSRTGGLVASAIDAPDAMAAWVRFPMLRKARKPSPAHATAGAVPGVSLRGLGHGWDDLPQDPGPAADLVPGDLLRGTSQEGHLGAAAAAQHGPRQRSDGLDPRPQDSLGAEPSARLPTHRSRPMRRTWEAPHQAGFADAARRTRRIAGVVERREHSAGSVRLAVVPRAPAKSCRSRASR